MARCSAFDRAVHASLQRVHMLGPDARHGDHDGGGYSHGMDLALLLMQLRLLRGTSLTDGWLDHDCRGIVIGGVVWWGGLRCGMRWLSSVVDEGAVDAFDSERETSGGPPSSQRCHSLPDPSREVKPKSLPWVAQIRGLRANTASGRTLECSVPRRMMIERGMHEALVCCVEICLGDKCLLICAC